MSLSILAHSGGQKTQVLESHPRLRVAYLMYMITLLIFYLATPAFSYLIFWEELPQLQLSAIHGLFLAFAFGLRFLLLLTGQMPVRNGYLALGYLLLVWISVLQIIWFPTISTQVGLEVFASTIAFTFINAWLVWLGGEALAYLIRQRRRLTWIALFVVYLGLVFVILDGIRRGFAFYGKPFFAFQNPVSLEVYNYLALADSLAIVGLLLLGISNRTFILYAVTLLLLLFAYSRTSFLLFLCVGLLLLSLRFRRRWKPQFILALLGIAIIALLAFIAYLVLVEAGVRILESIDLVLERMSILFTGSDPSMQSRLELLRQGLRLLEQHWLLGYFMGETVEAGKGAYIHNWLSFWLAYGIGPFVLSIWLLLSLIVKNWCQRKRNPLALIGFNLLVFVLLAVSFSRSYIWPYFWFGLSFGGAGLLSCRRRSI
ncbi:MAG: O-antigen ligase family protein [Anaerolineales bacterium]